MKKECDCNQTMGRFVRGFLLFVLFIFGLTQLQVMEYNHRASDAKLISAHRSGRTEMEEEACRLGFGRYEGTNFVWSSGVFADYSEAMLAIIQSKEQVTKVSQACLDLAKASIVGINALNILEEMDKNGVKEMTDEPEEPLDDLDLFNFGWMDLEAISADEE